MNIIKKVWDWVVYSSADPEKFSTTLKMGIPLLLLIRFHGVAVDATSANEFISALTNVVVYLGMFGTAIGTAYGFIRKIYLSFKA